MYKQSGAKTKGGLCLTVKKEQWASRWGFIAATIGMAIGTGNIWRFPRIAANNGGGSFLIAWTVALMVWSIPLLMAEMVIGRRARLGTIGAFRDFVGKKYTWMGAWIAWICLAIMFYYSVVMGWCIKYFTLAVSGAFTRGMTTEQTNAIWNAFTSSPSQTIFFHLVSITIGGYIVYKGIAGGIEKASKIMIPMLFVLLIIAVIRALTLPGSIEGVKYLFTPDFADLTQPKIWLEAFTQSAWSTGAGWGFIITYSVYTKEKSDVSLNCFLAGLGNNSASLVAGLAVLPTIFALSSTPEMASKALTSGNTGLTFIYLAQLFPTMTGGRLLASIFFLAMALAALSSLLAMIEVGVRVLMDAGLSRQRAAIYTTVCGFVMGIPSAWSIKFLDNQDWVLGVALLVSGLFCSFAIMKYGVEKARTEEINNPWSDLYIGKWWSWCIRLFPVMFIIIFGWWIWQAVTWYPDNWWAPFETFSVGTILFQFAIIFIVLLALNNWLAVKIGKASHDDEEVR